MKYSLLIAILLFVGMCSDEDDFSLDQQTIYFQAEFVNHAWGYQHQGFIIDQQGNIYDYEQPDDWNWTENNKISLTDFEANLEKAEARSSQLAGNEFEQMLNLATKVKTGDLTDLNSVMADAGAEVYAVYVANEGDQFLTHYLLQLRGDNYQKNTSNAANEISNWLIGLNDGGVFQEEHF